MKLQPKGLEGDGDVYFNVEWLSNFAHEKERLFVKAMELRIADIKYYAMGKWQNNQRYLRAFTFFSSLFGGECIFPFLKIKTKKHKTPWRMLLELITNYKRHNNMEPTKAEYGPVADLKIPIYIQQLFYRLLHHFREDKGLKYMMRSEYELLDQSLKTELVIFSTADGAMEVIKLSSFMHSLCDSDQMAIMKQYIWIVDSAKVTEMRDSLTSVFIRSDESYQVSNGLSFNLVFDTKSGGTEWCGLACNFEDPPTPLDGRVTFIIDELNVYCTQRMERAKGTARWLFLVSALQSIDNLTVRVSLHVTPSE